jgi:hypothetical protein
VHKGAVMLSTLGCTERAGLMTHQMRRCPVSTISGGLKVTLARYCMRGSKVVSHELQVHTMSMQVAAEAPLTSRV